MRLSRLLCIISENSNVNSYNKLKGNSTLIKNYVVCFLLKVKITY